MKLMYAWATVPYQRKLWSDANWSRTTASPTSRDFLAKYMKAVRHWNPGVRRVIVRERMYAGTTRGLPLSIGRFDDETK